MSATNAAYGKRRTVEPTARRHLLRVQVDETTRERLDALSERYQVARGTIAAGAIEAGLKAVTERLRRAARSTRGRGESEHAGAADRVGEADK